MRKKIVLYSLMLFTTLTGCDKFLSTEPKDFVAPETAFNTKEALQQGLNGVYSVLGQDKLYGMNMIIYLGLDADDGHQAQVSQLTRSGPHIYNFSATDTYVFYFWEWLYKGITRANVLLKYVDSNTEIEESFRNSIRGEALTLRAYYYFLLTTYFGDVPLMTEPSEDPIMTSIDRTDSRKVYEQIIADLTAAESLVLDIRDIGFGGRISKSAVRALASRVCLHWAGFPLKDESKYVDARNWALKVINDAEAGHALNPSYSDVFIKLAKDQYDIKENIWEVEFYGTSASTFDETGYLGRYIGPNSAVGSSIGRCQGLILTSGVLRDKYPIDDAEDSRKFWNIANFTYNNDGTKNMLTSVGYLNWFQRHVGKYRREYWPHPESNATSINYPLIRYSDVLLMFAEAENAINGPSEDAVEAVNKVRQRAQSSGVKAFQITNPGTGYTSAPTVTFTGGGGSGVSVKATVNGGSVTGFTFTADPVLGLTNGTGYTSAPAVSIQGGGGTGAQVQAILYNKSEANVPNTAIASKETFLAFIQDERSRELCFEGLRRNDLLRWGIFYEKMHGVYNLLLQNAPTAWFLPNYGNVVDEKHDIWPIPSSEIARNPQLTQNKHW
ncbi:MAG: RagB/SusD family nutrient uptake outer membrane protein [Sphingobacterium sp.]|jgi:hypothetical protein|uniref:RagB/SusD family nutrient uptake outer membrane protein n=1 Tax=Sphingobacterium tabacisoli TaxID=2044855 RepID=A0ABW5KZQ7_9SPHI|nr:RagB/SusD family nutrient uptake outer membrane protein [Sphingobacterium tabacisoli]MDR2283247.1 RagB/SusD family nutrient uptake outer membrane protein [Sphingobacterium sp.]